MARRPRKPNTVFKKRRNVGVPKAKSLSDITSTPNRLNESPNSTEPRPTTSQSSIDDLPRISTSEKKIGNLDDVYSMYNNNYSRDNVNIVLDLSMLSDALAQSVDCSQCGEQTIQVRLVTSIGLASSLEIFCTHCSYKHEFKSSKRLNNSKLYEANVRLVYGLRSIGKGQKPAQTLCGVMNLPPPPTHFESYIDVLGTVAEDVCFQSMKNAVDEAVTGNDGIRDLPVALDGTWQKRGHTSLNGVVTATSFDTGKVIDISILSKYCKCPNKENHSETCTANYKGSSGGMEVQGAVEIFSRSKKTYDVRYTQYLGDGDSKGFTAVQEMKPYGPDCIISKLECLGHIQKRMGSRLRKLKNENKHVKLIDGKGLGGKNRLSNAVIDQIQTYYGLAIRRNSDSLQNMVKDIWALYYHKVSTDDDPHHGLCPKGETSWCGYQKAIFGNKTYSHKNSVPVCIMEFIKPIFRSLSDKELLKKCLHGKTQNPNESVNAVIWSRLPKTGFVGLKTLHLGVYDAVSSFNNGNVTKCMVLHKLGMDIGKHTIMSMKKLDELRIQASKRSSSEIKKQARQKKRQVKRKLEDTEEDPDDPSYGAGLF